MLRSSVWGSGEVVLGRPTGGGGGNIVEGEGRSSQGRVGVVVVVVVEDGEV